MTLKGFFFVIILLTASWLSHAQVSEGLFEALSDSARPKIRSRVTLQELGYILRDYYSVHDLALRGELSDLARKYGQKYTQISNINERVKYLNDLSWFWYQINLPDSVDKYSKIALDQAALSPVTDPAKVGYALKMRGYLRIDKDDLSGAYSDLQEAIELFKAVSEMEQLSDCFSGLLMIYQKLQLYDRVIAGADSTLSFISQNSNPNFRSHLRPYLMLIKARAFIARYSSDKRAVNSDSAEVILFQVARLMESGQARWRIESYTELSRLSYYQNRFEKGVIYADSAFRLEGPLILENTNKQVRQAYKGLCLLKLGYVSQGISLLKSIKREGDAEYNSILLKKLFEYEYQQGNFQEAIKYQAELLEHTGRNQVMHHRGRVFELERENDTLIKDREIGRLQKKEQEVFRIIWGVFAFVCVTGLFIWNRYKIAQNKTKSLILQLNELTSMQMVRVEDAERRLRKKIAQDLHDDFSAAIATSSQFLKARANKESNPDDQSKLRLVLNLLQESYHRARTMSHQIYYDEGEAKFWEGLIDQVTMLFSGSNIELSVNFESEGLILPVEVKVTLLMIVKEAIVNILKHSKATQVGILFFRDHESLNLEVIDNGKGLSLTNRNGIGLDSITKRIKSLQGDLIITNSPGRGVTLKVTLPLPENN